MVYTSGFPMGDGSRLPNGAYNQGNENGMVNAGLSLSPDVMNVLSSLLASRNQATQPEFQNSVAPDPTWWDNYCASVAKWGARHYVTYGGDQLAEKLAEKVDFEIPHGMPGLSRSLIKDVQRTPGWKEFLGWTSGPLTVREKALLSQPDGYFTYLKKRFSGPRVSLASIGGWGNGALSIAKSNLKGLFAALESGRWLTALGSATGLGLFTLGIGGDTLKGYEQARLEEDTRHTNRWSTFGKTVFAFIKALLKAGPAWEMGGLGYLGGSILFGPWGPLGSAAGGIALGALLSVWTKRILDTVDKRWFGGR